jgi:tRNA (mo5U34)-methyltransferase
MSRSLQAEVDRYAWFHSIDFGDGIVSKGQIPLEVLQAQAEIYFPESLAGKTVLDIGAFDGWNSFEAMRRGARRVLATDHFAWSQGETREAFEFARARLAPRVEALDLDVPELTPAKIGTYDIVLFAGVLYHLRNPFLALETISKLVKETLIVETHCDALDISKPAMIFYPGDTLNGDVTNWWGPNSQCVSAMLREIGFATVTHTPHPTCGWGRGIFHARRT